MAGTRYYKHYKLYFGEDRALDEKRISWSNGDELATHTLTIRCRGKDMNDLRPLLDEIVAAYEAEELKGDKTHVYQMISEHSHGGGWSHLHTTHPRSPASVILSTGLMERVLADLDKFMAHETRKRYKALDLPYRRGWLFTGPPGNGKSSLVAVVAARLCVPIHIVSLREAKLQDADLAREMNRPRGTTHRPAVFLLEDIDRTTATTNTGLTLSGLFNVLDGHAAPENALIIMTTNHPEKLDPALIRPGRVDATFEFTPPTRDMVERYFARIARDPTDEVTKGRFIDRCAEATCMAHVQEMAREAGLLI